MADLNELQLTDDVIEVADVLPEERGARLPMLQPCTGQTFQLPEKFEGDTFATGQGQRVMLKFKDATALRTFPQGESVRGNISNMDQDRKNEKGETVKTNPLAYLLRNALGYTGPLKSNKDYIEAIKQYAGHYFVADWVWQANCAEKRDIYVDGQGVVKGRSGCGQKYALKGRSYKDKKSGALKSILPIPRDESRSYKESWRCVGKRPDDKQCEATIFANGELSNFKPVPQEAEEGETPQS